MIDRKRERDPTLASPKTGERQMCCVMALDLHLFPAALLESWRYQGMCWWTFCNRSTRSCFCIAASAPRLSHTQSNHLQCHLRAVKPVGVFPRCFCHDVVGCSRIEALNCIYLKSLTHVHLCWTDVLVPLSSSSLSIQLQRKRIESLCVLILWCL